MVSENPCKASGATWLMASLVVVLSAACAGPSPTVAWPDQAVAEAPTEVAEGEPRLVRADNGLLFAVGEFESTPKRGDYILGRFDGSWPVEQMDRPALFAGQVVEVVDEQRVHVHPLHEFDDVEHRQLRLEVATTLGEETMGKGIGQVEAVDYEGAAHLELNLGSQEGASSGDLYAIVDGPSEGAQASQMQLTQRFIGVCMIVEVEADNSLCRLRQGHPTHRWAGRVAEGQQALFLEPSFGTSPQPARVLVSPTGDEAVDAAVMEQLSGYLERFPAGAVTVAPFSERVDPRDKTFYRWNRQAHEKGPAVMVGVSVVERDGQRRLHMNYTGLGPAVGPGMVASPPEGGVDMGPVEDLEELDLTGPAAVIMGLVLINRGQNAEALSHLHDALRDRRLQGPWRWHARDQYAMRWAAAGRVDEAMWLVLQDEALAEADGDEKARLNALGTRVRLHDHLDQPEQALDQARRFESAYDDRQQPSYQFARAMTAEMAVSAGDSDAAFEAVEELDALCPEGCKNDLVYMLAGVYWGADEKDDDLQDRVVDRMVEITQGQRDQARGATRMFQGWTFMRDGNFEQALMAFLEARRLYERNEATHGAARAEFFVAVTQGHLGNRQDAFELGLESLEYMTSVGDYGSMVRIYSQLAHLYLTIDPEARPERFMSAAPRVMRAHMEARLATGDYGRTAEAGFGYGLFMRFAGSLGEARRVLQSTVVYGLRVARFDIVARAHLQLALVARMAGDEQGFEQEVARAQLIADAIDDPGLDEEINQVLSPGESGDEPTQLL